ncbi:hypothetical protein H257_04209 [Aphanomyces astaci]|uniref:Uncharacterized protein n=1 Tax=Aphanomyces astaci TaxID=112090 RepID=W4GX44_APHAT|nr:hypothetical protein H257_04209 [Aphanomyces astaci]ETV83488.1 hypothetical protein H257_04209 [Aphanomyces astaci]|eukprot:XP_009826918.1 hypothetical protein H257_04209 [Aphanomyces astaci]
MAIVKIVNVATVKPVRRAAFESDSESDDETDRLTKKPKKSPGTKDDVNVSRVPGDDYFAAWNASDVQLTCVDEDGTTVMWKQSVLSFNGCQELSEHGAGKTPPGTAV